MNKSGWAWVMLLVLLAGCAGPAAPTAALPTPTPPQVPPFLDIPPAAWSRLLGQPFTAAGHPKTSYPMIDDGPFQGLPLGGLALEKIFKYNVQSFANGTMGAVNGMRPNGSVDDSAEQAQEVWVGTTYALAAGMYQEGLHDEAWQTAWGLYNVTYLTKGLWFRTPEAWDENGNFLASMYMRP